MIIVYITCKDKKEAKKISIHLLKKRLIACANLFPIESLYWWKNKINQDKEIVIIAKTQKENFLSIQKEVKKNHSYKVPCIDSWDVDNVDEDYLKWLNNEIK